MGHEIAGRVAMLGETAGGPAVGRRGRRHGGVGVRRVRWCEAGHEQLCPDGKEAGATADGGFAELVLVPHRRFLVPLGDLDPVEATPLGCAGITAYAAVTRVRPWLEDGGTLVVIGVGGLGGYAVQIGASADAGHRGRGRRRCRRALARA